MLPTRAQTRREESRGGQALIGGEVMKFAVERPSLGLTARGRIEPDAPSRGSLHGTTGPESGRFYATYIGGPRGAASARNSNEIARWVVATSTAPTAVHPKNSSDVTCGTAHATVIRRILQVWQSKGSWWLRRLCCSGEGRAVRSEQTALSRPRSDEQARSAWFAA